MMSDGAAPTQSAFTVRQFCERNNIGHSNFYRAVEFDFIRITRYFGKTVVTVEDEAAFRQLLKDGKLVWPEEAKRRKPGQRERSRVKAKRLANSPLRKAAGEAAP
jgi:hypothetical protein